MKNPDTGDLERLAEIAELPRDHPERVAWESDAQRRVLLRCYLDFVADEPGEGDEVRVPRAQLREAIRNEIGVSTDGRGRRHATVPLWMRAALAAAALVLVALGLRHWSPHDLGPTGFDRGAVEPQIHLLPSNHADGHLELGWTALPGAEEYVVTLFRPDLSELLRLPATPDARVRIATSRLDSLGVEATVIWRVTAYAEGDAIGSSSVGYAAVP